MPAGDANEPWMLLPSLHAVEHQNVAVNKTEAFEEISSTRQGYVAKHCYTLALLNKASYCSCNEPSLVTARTYEFVIANRISMKGNVWLTIRYGDRYERLA